MVANIPAKLRSADITRFAQRAAQVEKLKPPIAYWSYYYMVQQILNKGLHNQDEECKQYTSDLMDKLEEIKAQSPEDGAILDDMAGQAYIEQFGSETFQRADNAMGANRSSRQTADTFQAAATFLELVQIWGQPTPELTQRIKYAKYHALRIAKALKAGEDPNLSNPAPIPPPTQESMQLDPNDPEVQAFTDGDRRPRVEDIPDETASVPDGKQSMWLGRYDEQPASSRPQSAKSPFQPSPADLVRRQDRPPSPAPPPPTAPSETNGTAEETPASANNRSHSIGGGYFPDVQLPEVPSTPTDVAPGPMAPMSPTGYISPSSQIPPAPPSDPPEVSPQDFYAQQPPTRGVPPPAAPPTAFSPPPPQAQYQPQQPPYVPSPAQQGAPQPPPLSPHAQQPFSTPTPFFPSPQQAPHYAHPLSPQAHQPPHQPPPARALPPSAQAQAPRFEPDDVAMLQAQKHAKWAISALNFEDVPTAVLELRKALQTLGAS